MAFNKPQLINTRAPINHNHDDLYSKTNHTHTKLSNDLKFESGQILDCNGRAVLTPYSSAGNVVLGYGNYNDRTGKSTNVYGDILKFLSNNDISFNKRIILPVGEDGGIRFANDDTITFNDSDNVYTFKHDTSAGDYYSKICCGGILIGADKKPAFSGSLGSAYDTSSYFYLGGILICYGRIKAKCTTGGTPIATTISFPKTFNSTPFINLSVNTGAPQQCSVGVTDISTSSFVANFCRTNTTETSVFWFAIGQA